MLTRNEEVKLFSILTKDIEFKEYKELDFEERERLALEVSERFYGYKEYKEEGSKC